jgi:hypothetical protein
MQCSFECGIDQRSRDSRKTNVTKSRENRDVKTVVEIASHKCICSIRKASTRCWLERREYVTMELIPNLRNVCRASYRYKFMKSYRHIRNSCRHLVEIQLVDKTVEERPGQRRFGYWMGKRLLEL